MRAPRSNIRRARRKKNTYNGIEEPYTTHSHSSPTLARHRCKYHMLFLRILRVWDGRLDFCIQCTHTHTYRSIQLQYSLNIKGYEYVTVRVYLHYTDPQHIYAVQARKWNEINGHRSQIADLLWQMPIILMIETKLWSFIQRIAQIDYKSLHPPNYANR